MSKLGDFNLQKAGSIIMGDYDKERIRQIALDDLEPDPNQPRRDFKDMGELVNSIQEKGVIQPLLVRPVGSKYRIIVGERRYRAAQQVDGFYHLPCIVLMDLSDSDALEMQIIENLQRDDLNPIEETQGIIDLLNLKMSAFEEFKNFERGAISVLNTMHNYKRGKITHNVMGKIQKVVEDVFSLAAMEGWTY